MGRAVTDTNTNPPAGWHPDGSGGERYWDGTAWTDQTRPGAQQGAPQQAAYATPQQPVKKKHTVRNVLLVLVLLFVLFAGGCAALFGVVLNEADKALDEEAKNDIPTAIEEGAAFEHDGFSVAKGWSVKPDQFGGATIERATVTLKDDQGMSDGRDAMLTFRLYDGKTVVSEILCSANTMQEGESSRLDCSSLDTEKLGKWDTIKVADTW